MNDIEVPNTEERRWWTHDYSAPREERSPGVEKFYEEETYLHPAHGLFVGVKEAPSALQYCLEVSKETAQMIDRALQNLGFQVGIREQISRVRLDEEHLRYLNDDEFRSYDGRYKSANNGVVEYMREAKDGLPRMILTLQAYKLPDSRHVESPEPRVRGCLVVLRIPRTYGEEIDRLGSKRIAPERVPRMVEILLEKFKDPNSTTLKDERREINEELPRSEHAEEARVKQANELTTSASIEKKRKSSWQKFKNLFSSKGKE